MVSILAIEDQAVNRVTLLATANALGLDLTVAHSLGAAAAVLAVQPFDLILIEWHLVGDDEQLFLGGLNRLTERFSGGRLPIVALSALPLSDETCRGCGIDGYLAKPYKIDDFARKLEQYLGHDLPWQSQAS